MQVAKSKRRGYRRARDLLLNSTSRLHPKEREPASVKRSVEQQRVEGLARRVEQSRVCSAQAVFRDAHRASHRAASSVPDGAKSMNGMLRGHCIAGGTLQLSLIGSCGRRVQSVLYPGRWHVNALRPLELAAFTHQGAQQANGKYDIAHTRPPKVPSAAHSSSMTWAVQRALRCQRETD